MAVMSKKAAAQDIKECFVEHEVDPSKHSVAVAYLKVSITTVKECREACEYILQHGNRLQRSRAKQVLDDLKDCNKNELRCVWYVDKTVQHFQVRMSQGWPFSLQSHGVTDSGVIAISPTKSYVIALICEGLASGLFQYSTGEDKHCKKLLNLNLVECGGRKPWNKVGTMATMEWTKSNWTDHLTHRLANWKSMIWFRK
jgi:hypothetical protein